MDFIERIVSIRTTLENNGYRDLANGILNAQMEMGTQGELFAKVCSKIIVMKKNKEAYKLIHKDADWLLNYAKKIGYNIIPS